MKTIEERAEKYADKVWTNPMFAQEWEECKRDYIQGATEQRAIDIECLSKRINELFGKSEGAEINGSWWDIDEIEEFLMSKSMEE